MTSPSPSYRFIPLTQDYWAMVDAEDYERVMQFKWQVDVDYHPNGVVKGIYATSGLPREGKKPTTQKLHRFILGVTNPQIHIDHENHNGLNCRRYNLRLSDATRNQWNSRRKYNSISGFKGVDFYKMLGKWRARINVNRETIYLGFFDSAEDAARAYDAAALRYHGEFALTNRMLGYFEGR